MLEGFALISVRSCPDELGEMGERTPDMPAGPGAERGHDRFPIQGQRAYVAAAFLMASDLFEPRFELIEPGRANSGFFGRRGGREFEPSPYEESVDLLLAETTEDLANTDLAKRFDTPIDGVGTMNTLDSSRERRGHTKPYERTLDLAPVEPGCPSQGRQRREMCEAGLTQRVHPGKECGTDTGFAQEGEAGFGSGRRENAADLATSRRCLGQSIDRARECRVCGFQETGRGLE